MHRKNIFLDDKYGLAYYCLDEVIVKSIERVVRFKLEFHISDKNFKYVADKLFLHYFYNDILDFLRQHSVVNSKPVLFLSEEKMHHEDLKTEVILKQLKVLKGLLPIPFIMPLPNNILFFKNSGELKELNEKIMNFYAKRRVSTQKLKKYFDDKGYNTLSATLSSTVNLKHLFY